MANTVSLLSLTNTFLEQMGTINSLAKENNDLAANNYTKNTGTFITLDPSLALQANGPSLFYNTIQVLGPGSSVTVQNNLGITQGQLRLGNTTILLDAPTGKGIFGGQLIANSSGVGLAVSNNATVGGFTAITGNASVIGPVTMGNTLTVTGAASLSNTLTVTGAATLSNTLSVVQNAFFNNNIIVTNNATGYNLIANNNTNTSTLNVITNSFIGGNEVVAGTLFANVVQSNTSVNTATLSVTGRTFTNILQSNTVVNTATLSVTGQTYTNNLQANTNIVSGNVIVTNNTTTNYFVANTSVSTPILSATTTSATGTGFVNVLQANTNVNTATLSVTGITYTNNLQANTNVNTATLSVTGVTYSNTIQANTSVSSPTISATTLSATGTGYVNILQANTSVNTAVVNSATQFANSAYVNNLQANTNIVSSALTVTNAITGSNIKANNGLSATTLSISGTEYVDTISANTLIYTPTLSVGTSITACNASMTANSLTVGTGGLSVIGNFTINGATVYNTPTFTLSSNTPNQTVTINAYRTGTGGNASIKWDQTNTYWSIADSTANGYYYRILTTQQIVDNVYSTSTTTAASANVANALNNFITTTTGNLQQQISQNVANLSTSISTNVSIISGIDATQNSWISANQVYSQASYARANTSANLFVGTSGTSVPSNGTINLTSTNGVTITGSGNTLTISTPQDLRTSASPTFNALSLTTALPITQGGTGATDKATAMFNLLPTTVGVPAGYVLGTGGGGGSSFYWTAGGTGGGGGSAVPGTTIASSKTTATGNGSGLAYSTPVYVPGTDQLRVYFNGIRQTSGYTETSGNTGGVGIVTFGSSPTNGTSILLEVDGYILNPYFANNITFTSPVGGIVSSANTIQLAIQDLETRKATLVSPTFTGTPAAPTPLTANSDTQIATTAFVKNVLGSGSTYGISISGNAGTATTLQTPRAINGVNFDGSTAITVTADASTLSGTTLKSTVVSSSLTSVGTIATGVWNGSTIPVAYGGTGVTVSTGSGYAVLNSSPILSSPTLVTPILGTPQSGNFSSGTFTWPTFNQNTSGQAGSVVNGVYTTGTYYNPSWLAQIPGSIVNGGVALATSANTLSGVAIQTLGVVPIESRVLRSDNSGYAVLGYINSNTNNDENPTVSQVIVTNGSDNYYRKSSISSFTSAVQSAASGNWGINVTGTSANLSGSPTITVSGANVNGTLNAYTLNVNGPTGTPNILNVNANFSGLSSTQAASIGGIDAGVAFTGIKVAYKDTVSLNDTGSYPLQVFGNGSVIAYVNGSGNFTASGSVTSYSDARLKTNVQTITGALDKVSQLRGVSFDKDGTKQIGVIAQEIREVLPEVVLEGTDEDKTLSVSYGNIVGVLIEAIKELKAEIEVLKSTK